MFHGLPMQGYCNHGFFNYHPVFFERLAEANEYQIVGMWAMSKEHETWFPATENMLDKIYSQWIFNIHNSIIHLWILLRKTNNMEFIVPFHS